MVIHDLDDNCGYHHDLGNLHIANPHDIHLVNPMIDPFHHHFYGWFSKPPPVMVGYGIFHVWYAMVHGMPFHVIGP